MIDWESDPIAIAKSLAELCAASRDEFVGVKGRDYRDWIAEGHELPLSGRQLGRYLRLLKTPKEVREACSRGELGMTDVLNVASLPEEKQEEIVDAICFGDCPKDAVRTRLDSAANNYRMLMSFLDFALAGLEAEADTIVQKGIAYVKAADILGRLESFARKMKRLEKKARKESDRAMQNILSKL